MCGIFGVALRPGASRKAALQKVKIMGLYNIKRGKDASGMCINGNIIKGVGKISEFDDFIEDTIFPIPKENTIVLGHTRAGSWGYKKTLEEAHPFLINESLVFTHNGTIKNVKELCKKYKLEEDNYSVDSQVLGTIIEEDGLGVLDIYTGAAALAFTRKEEENVLYLYHGKSKDYKYAQPSEERPLFFMETRDGLYYSSLLESLEAIRDSEDEVPYNLKYNTVFKIENGKFVFDLSHTVDREEANVEEYVTPVHVGKRSKTPSTYNHMGGTADSGSGGTKNNSRGVSIDDECLIKRESLPLKALEKGNFIYYHRGRYWETPRKIMQGPRYIKKGNLFGTADDKISKLYFFWEGVMLKSKSSYDELKRMNENSSDRNWVRHPNEHNFALRVSSHSKWPLCNVGAEGFTLGDYYRKIWYNNGSDCGDLNFTPDFSAGRNYKLVRGFLTKIMPSQREDTLWNNKQLAEDEIIALVSGSLLAGVSGGVSDELPFRTDSSGGSTTTSRKEPEEDELVWFFDVDLLSLKHADENIGEDELEALREFVRITYKQDFKLDPLSKEVDGGVKDMIESAIAKKMSIMDTLTHNMDKNLLEKCYDKVIEGVHRKEHLQSHIDLKSELVEKAIVNFDDVDEEVDPEVIEDIVEGSITDLENMQVSSMELQAIENSDYAQDACNILLVGVDNMLSNLQGVLEKHKKKDFVNRVIKIRETKSFKNGVI